jgi:thiamine-phosphate pyrophosphorylase
MATRLKLVLFTTPEKLMSECSTIDELLKLGGIDYLHIRKDTGDDEYVRKIVNRLPKGVRNQLVVHGHQEVAEQYKLGGLHHKSNSVFNPECTTEFQTKAFHSIDEIKGCKLKYRYGFLSPIFDSISKADYNANFDYEELKEFLHSDQKPFPIYALGGVYPGNIQKCKELGFDGVGILGAIWGEIFLHKKIEVFEKIKEQL